MEIPIMLREHQNGSYRVFAYYLSKVIIQIPQFTLIPFMFVVIIYWMSNLNNDGGRFLICCLIIILVANCSVSFGECISAAAPSLNVALAMSGPVLVPLMIFSGFFLNNASVPDYFIWLKYLSWLNYANELLMINQWDGVKNITCTTVGGGCLTTGAQVLSKLSFDTVIMKFSIFYLLISTRIL